MIEKLNGQKSLAQVILAGVLASVGTFIVFWFTLAGGLVDRAEILELIQETAPYIEDRKLLEKGVTDNAREVKAISERLREIETLQTVLSTKLDVLLLGRLSEQ